MFLSAILAVVLLKSIVWTVGFGYLPPLVAVAFSIFALVGAINAFNIIDGLNGLASGLGIISALTYFVISKQLNLQEVALLNLIFIASVLGFFVWNFPKGKIFLGDTGSYFIGFFIGVMSILIAGGYHSQVSPWVAMLVMFYPVWETLFSFWRRIKEGKNPFEPDKKHLHHLLYFYFGKSHFKAVSLILISQAVADLLVIKFKSETYILIGLFILFALLYILVYKILEKKLRLDNP
jgi:UDP-N-acetylmuramyl pentapeptide phosphotransferase/UDP-N-acetylglucosamine-1-phosphate transferase